MEITDEQFDRIVQRAIDSIDPQFRSWLDEVPVIVEDQPSTRIRHQMKLRRHSLLGLFQGVPLNKRHVDAPAGPSQITLYRIPILQASQTLEQLEEQIRITLVHELGHFLGFSESQLRKQGY